ncbi:tyrosine-type recombinase/integrase [Candidatus Babeliales bacterium]|nr:tyrosine-type recombinase/integrase [Candidatus Babeliales bacterium]
MYFEEFLHYKDDFLSYIDIERNLTHNTQRSYKSDLNLFITFWETITEKNKEEISLRRALERYFVNLFYKKIDKSSVARKISCFKSFELFAKKLGKKISLKLKRPRIDKKLPTYLTVDEIFYLLDTVKDDELPSKRPLRDKAIFELLYATGIRCSELCGIKYSDIDIPQKTIRITGKGRKERFVLFGKKAQQKIEQYLTHERPNITDPHDLLFVSQRNIPLNPRTIQRIIQMFRNFLQGNKAITPHKIRHSFATHLLNQGADLRVVQELLGHETLSSTEKYTHITSTQLADMCDSIHPLNSMKKKK